MRRPVNAPYTITTEFGVKDPNAFFGYHSGVDYAVPLDRAVLAPAAGKIVYLANNATGGNMVIIHDGQFYHRLMHNNSFASGLKVNDLVAEGQTVAYAGTTGLSTGVHSHWDIMDEIISSTKPRPTSFAHFKDPAKWLAGEYNTAPKGGSEVFNTIEEVKEAYLQMRGVVGTDAEMRGWIGQSKQRWIQVSKAETDSTRKQLADVKAALANEKAKPAKEVIKEVIKIVEKPVEVIKEVPVAVDEKQVVTNVLVRFWNSLFKK